jgi:hypothetical protein
VDSGNSHRGTRDGPALAFVIGIQHEQDARTKPSGLPDPLFTRAVGWND